MATKPRPAERPAPLSVYRHPEILAALEARATDADVSASEWVRRIVVRYEEMVRRSRPELDERQWNLIRDALNGILILDQWSPAYVSAEIEDAIALNRLDLKWEVDGPALLARLRALTYPQLVAIVDDAERFWANSTRE